MMYFQIVFIVFTFHSLWTDASDGVRDANWPHNMKTPFPYPTYAPMRIDTSLARPANTSTPLKITVPLKKKLQITNTGITVVAKLKEPNNDFTISDGILQDAYVFDGIFYTWSQDHLGACGATVDGAGAPLVGVVTFYKRQYKSLNEAKEHRDGIVIFLVKVIVQGVLPNKEFSKFEPALRSVTDAGSNSETTVEAAASFFGLDPEPSYYAYPGAYYDSLNKKQSFSATIIELPASHYPSISIAQFSAFTNLKNHDNSPIDYRINSYALDSRPIVQGNGVIHQPIQ